MKRLIILISVFLCSLAVTQAQLVDTYINPQEAYAETQKTLVKVSNVLNNALDPLRRVANDISKANEIVNESLGKIR